MCTDYRILSKEAIEDHYLLPPMGQLLDRLSQARAFSKSDLAQGYYQIALAEESIDKTSFLTHLDQWEYVVRYFWIVQCSKKIQEANE